MTIPSVASAAAVSPTAPNPPTNVTTSDLGALRRTTWTDNASNEDNQHIQRRSRVAGTSMWGAWVTLDAAIAPNVTTSDDGTGGSGFEYQYQVRAENAAGVSPWAIGNAVCVAQAPGTPTGLNATAVLFSDSEIDLSWNAPSGTVQTYGIWRDGQFLQEVTGTTFRDSGLAAGTEYCYTVDARNACLPPSSQSPQVCETTNIIPPSDKPDVTSFVPVSASQFEVEWTAVARAEFYEIQTDGDPLFGTPDPIHTSAGTDLDEIIGGYPDKLQKYVRVRAGNTAGSRPLVHHRDLGHDMARAASERLGDPGPGRLSVARLHSERNRGHPPESALRHPPQQRDVGGRGQQRPGAPPRRARVHRYLGLRDPVRW